MLIIAHRGASADFPEQTGAAIAAAWEQGADGVEVDLRLTRDGRLLLQHDATLLRCCGDPRRVAQLDSRERLALNACRARPELAPESPLLLEEALELVPPGRLLLLELKGGAEQVAPLVRALDGRHDGLLLIAFNLDALREARVRLPGLPALWLRGGKRPPAASTLARWRRALRRAGAAGLDLDERLIDAELARTITRDSLLLGAWTVDDAEQSLRLRDFGVAWLTTNRPGALRAGLLSGAKRTARG